jgi:hypothetical protein
MVDRRVLIATIAACMIMVASIIGFAAFGGEASSLRGSAPRGPFTWLAQTSLPSGWTRLDGVPRLGSLPVPPGFRAVAGDRGSLTAALFGPGGAYLGYLNATPIEGGELLQGWPEFRLKHLRDDDARQVHVDAAAQAVRTRTALRSCVIDDYVTRVGQHRFHEVACLVMYHSVGRVIVAASPSGDPAHVFDTLERAVATYPLA